MSVKAIRTGVSALYKQNLISYSPQYDHLEMIFGTNTTNYQHKKVKITLQNENTINIGVIEIDDKKYYCPERLFIELDKFNLESTVKNEAKRKLLASIDPEKTKRIYEKLKSTRRGIDNEFIESFLNKNLLYIKEKLKKANDKKVILREYIMALVSRKNVPVTLIKGGSSIELYTSINRSTLDVDTHTHKNSIPNIIAYLIDNDKDVYFRIDPNDEKKLTDIENGNATKRVFTFELFPISKGGTLKKELENISISITFNTTYSDIEIKEIISTYKITHRNLKLLPNATCIVFTREMLLAEKFQSIISKPRESTRTKDLIDLKLLWSDNINYVAFRKWLFRKWANQSHPLSEEDAKKEIVRNRDLELIKIKNNYTEAVSMYGFKASYDECLFIYNKLADEALK